MRWAGYVARMGEDIKLYKVSVGKPEGKRPLGRPRRRWRMGSEWILLLGRWAGGVEWIQLAQDRDRWRALLVNTEMNLRVLAPWRQLNFINNFVLVNPNFTSIQKYCAYHYCKKFQHYTSYNLLFSYFICRLKYFSLI
jgi:hypothetical protein